MTDFLDFHFLALINTMMDWGVQARKSSEDAPWKNSYLSSDIRHVEKNSLSKIAKTGKSYVCISHGLARMEVFWK